MNQDATVGSDQLAKSVGTAVQTRRLQLNLSQDELCKGSGINKSLLVRLEAGLVDVEVLTLHRLAVALESTLVRLLEMAESEFA